VKPVLSSSSSPPITHRTPKKETGKVTPAAFHITTHGFFLLSALEESDDEGSVQEKPRPTVLVEEFGKETFGDKNFVLDREQIHDMWLDRREKSETFTCASPADASCWEPYCVLYYILIEGMQVEYVRSSSTFLSMLAASRLPQEVDVERALSSISSDSTVITEDLCVGDIVAILPSTLHRFLRKAGFAQVVRFVWGKEYVAGYKGTSPREISVDVYPCNITQPGAECCSPMFPVEKFRKEMEFLALQSCFHIPFLLDGLYCDVDMDLIVPTRTKTLDEHRIQGFLDDREFDQFEDVEKTRGELLKYTRLGANPQLRRMSLWTLKFLIECTRSDPENFFYERFCIGDPTTPQYDDALELLGKVFPRPLPEIRSQDLMTLVIMYCLILGISFFQL